MALKKAGGLVKLFNSNKIISIVSIRIHINILTLLSLFFVLALFVIILLLALGQSKLQT